MSWGVIAAALWLGILTSISPCPLASNIAAISFISRRVGKGRHVLLSGLLYTFGRVIAYVGVSVIVVAGLLASGELVRFLQRYMNQILGPLLILVGMLLLGMLGGGFSMNLAGERVQERVSRGSLWWAVPLGVLFALSFCPISAGLFFGGLTALAVKSHSRVLVPALFGVGTAIPVLVFAFLIAFGGQYLGKAFNRLTQVERWVRRVTGALLIAAGIFLTLVHIYGLPLLSW